MEAAKDTAKKETAKKERLKKGYYRHKEAGAFLSVKQFIVTEREDERCLLLRFVNESDVELHEVHYLLTQLDAEGREIAHTKITYKNVAIRPGADYFPKTGALLKEDCVDFRVRVLHLISGVYRYVFRNGRAVPLYDTRGYGEEKRSREIAERDVRFRRRFAGLRRVHSLAAVVGILLLIAACFLAIWQEGDSFGTKPKEQQEIAVNAPLHPSAPIGDDHLLGSTTC